MIGAGMSFSKKVALVGLAVGVLGVFSGEDVPKYGGFIILAAACVCRSIEDYLE